MSNTTARRAWLCAALAGLAAARSPARAQSAWPSRPVKIIAPVQPGGGVDLVARTVAERLARAMSASFVVENMAGGGGVIASQAVARAAPDGHTLMVGYVGTHGTNPATRRIPYDALRDFTPVAMVGGTPNVLVASATMGIDALERFIAFARANPGRLSYGSSGPGSLTHLAMEQFKQAANIFAVHVPYRGIGPAIVDAISGQVQCMFPGLAAALPHIRAGRLVPLAVTGTRRHPLVPAVPTLEERGFKGFDGVQWYGIVGPARMPEAVVRRLNEEINAQLATPELRERLAGEALEPMPMSPAQFGEYMAADIAKWTALVRERKLELE